MDGWVLRLGVGASDAFEYSIGDQGLGFGADAPVRSTPIHAILGNFLHLDDGDFVTSGDSSPPADPEETRAPPRRERPKPLPTGVLADLRRRPRRPEGRGRARRPLEAAGARRGWHPFTVLWCVDYVDRSRAVLEGVFAEAMTRAGNPGPQFDRAVEDSAHGVGRALWRDIRCAAENGARHGGPLHELVRAGVGIDAARRGFGLRVVAESEGAFALAALLGVLRTGPTSPPRPAPSSTCSKASTSSPRR